MKIYLNTNVFIYFLKRIEPQANKVEKILSDFMKSKHEGIVSTVTIAEILTGVYKSEDQNKHIQVRKLLNDLTLNSFKIIPVSFEIADLAANLRAKRGGRLPDALIAATALNQNSNLIYSQDKDMQRFSPEIRICELP